MRPDDGGGTASGQQTPTVEPYESFANPDKKFNVDVDDLLSYSRTMLLLQGEAQAKALEELMPIGELVRLGLSNPPADQVSPFPEAQYIAQTIRQRQSDFQHAFMDITGGIGHLGSASAVIAEICEGADSESAAKLSDIAFAFQDPTAERPAGFTRKFETWADLQAKAAAQAANQPMALSGSDYGLTGTSVASGYGVATYQYSDGSSKVVQSYYDPSIGGMRTTTSYYAAGGKLLQSNTEADGKDGTTGERVQTTSTTRYDGETGSGTQSSSTTTTHTDGTLTVSSETATVDADGTTSDVKQGETITVVPGEHQQRATTSPGPVERAVNETGSYGTDDWVQAAGRTY